MKLAILSDIHEDIISLTKAFRKIEKSGCDQVVCLGDISGYGVPYYHHFQTRNSHECLQMIRRNCKLVIAGNHDLYAARRIPSNAGNFVFPENWYELDYHQKLNYSQGKVWLYQHDELDPLYTLSDIHYINTLKEVETSTYEKYPIMFTHYVYPNVSGCLKGIYETPDQYHEHFQWIKNQGCGISFTGHTHHHGMMIVSKSGTKHVRFNKWADITAPCCISIPSIANNNNKGGFCIFNVSKQKVCAVRI